MGKGVAWAMIAFLPYLLLHIQRHVFHLAAPVRADVALAAALAPGMHFAVLLSCTLFIFFLIWWHNVFYFLIVIFLLLRFAVGALCGSRSRSRSPPRGSRRSRYVFSLSLPPPAVEVVEFGVANQLFEHCDRNR